MLVREVFFCRVRLHRCVRVPASGIDRSMERYHIRDTIGKGSFGNAMRAIRKADGLVCIVKRIGLSGLSKREMRLVRQEAKLLATLRHPHIVSHLDTFVVDRSLCIAMEYCQGGDLERWVDRTRRTGLPQDHQETVTRFVVQVCLALEHVHSKRVVHRDVKSSNLFLMRQEGEVVVKLGDFGISRVLAAGENLCATSIGTPCYMAPELLEERPYDYKVDVWSAGCVLYELFALKRAFVATSLAGIVRRVVREPAPTLRGPLGDLLSRMLAKRPADRPDVTDVLASLALLKTPTVPLQGHTIEKKGTTRRRAPPRFLSPAPSDEETSSSDDDEDEYRDLGNGWWLKKDSSSNKWFYVHEATGHSQWEPPSPDASRKQLAAKANGEDQARKVRDAVRAKVERSREKRTVDSPAPAKQPDEEKSIPNEWLGDLENRMGDLRSQLGQMKRQQLRRKPPDTPAVYVCSLPVDKPPDQDESESLPPLVEKADEEESRKQLVAPDEKTPVRDARKEDEQGHATVSPPPPEQDSSEVAYSEQRPPSPVLSQVVEDKESPSKIQEPPKSSNDNRDVPAKSCDRPALPSKAVRAKAARDASRAELRRRIAQGRRHNQDKEFEIEVLAPSKPPPPPPPPAPKPRRAVSLYDYLASKNEVDDLLRRVSEPEPPQNPHIGDLVAKLRLTLEKQREITSQPRIAAVDESEEHETFLDCVSTLTPATDAEHHNDVFEPKSPAPSLYIPLASPPDTV